MDIAANWSHASPLLVMGAVFLAAAGFGGWRTRRFLDGAKRAEARVIGFEERESPRLHGTPTQTIFHPVVEFITLAGEEVTATTTTGSMFPDQPGGVVNILYDPGDPKQVRLDTGRGRGLPAVLVIGVLGLGILLFGLKTLTGG